MLILGECKVRKSTSKAILMSKVLSVQMNKKIEQDSQAYTSLTIFLFFRDVSLSKFRLVTNVLLPYEKQQPIFKAIKINRKFIRDN
jgi:hypothetical protein